jgi:hypothetical protein
MIYVNYVNANILFKILKEFVLFLFLFKKKTKYSLLKDHLFTTKHIENIRSILSKQMGNVSTIKDENIKKNSINIKLDLDNSPTSVLDKSSKDEQNQIMSYFNLMHLMPMGLFLIFKINKYLFSFI